MGAACAACGTAAAPAMRMQAMATSCKLVGGTSTVAKTLSCLKSGRTHARVAAAIGRSRSTQARGSAAAATRARAPCRLPRASRWSGPGGSRSRGPESTPRAIGGSPGAAAARQARGLIPHAPPGCATSPPAARRLRTPASARAAQAATSASRRRRRARRRCPIAAHGNPARLQPRSLPPTWSGCGPPCGPRRSQRPRHGRKGGVQKPAKKLTFELVVKHGMCRLPAFRSAGLRSGTMSLRQRL